MTTRCHITAAKVGDGIYPSAFGNDIAVAQLQSERRVSVWPMSDGLPM
jgi:hypothetical protein